MDTCILQWPKANDRVSLVSVLGVLVIDLEYNNNSSHSRSSSGHSRSSSRNRSGSGVYQ